MNEITPKDQVKIDKALQVYDLLVSNPRMSQEKACKHIGIDPKTYRKWIGTQEEVLQLFEQTRIDIERNEYAACLAAKYALTEKLITDAMKPGVSISERIKVLEYVDQRIEELSGKFHAVDVEAEQDLLSGPSQVPGVSRLANRVTIEESKDETVIRVKDKKNILDITPESLE